MKGLEPGETYLWHVHQATGEGDPCAAGSTVGNPAPYPGWTYRALTARSSGNASAKGRSSGFPAAGEPSEGGHYVNVHLQDGTVIACGVLESRRARGGGKKDDGDDRPAAKGKGHESGTGRGRHRRGDDDHD